MRASGPRVLPLLLSASLVLTTSALAAGRPVGFQRIQVPGIGPAGVEVGLWYPSRGSPVKKSLGLWSHEVVVDGPVTGSRIPVVMLSHGVYRGGLGPFRLFGSTRIRPGKVPPGVSR